MPLFNHFEAQTIKMFLMLFIAAGLAKRRHAKGRSRVQSSNTIENRRRTKREPEEHGLHKRAAVPTIEPELKQEADQSSRKKSYRHLTPKEEPQMVEPKIADPIEPLDEDPPGIEMNFGEGFPMDPLDDPLAIDMHEYR